MEADKWTEFCIDYDEKVFSITKFPERRKQILEYVNKGSILNLGTGPTAHLNRDLVEQCNSVYASDFCKPMLDVAKKDYTHPKLEYILADTKDLPFEDDKFDSVVSVNSILPPEREEVDVMINEVYRVLKNNGKFIALFPSYELVSYAISELNFGIEHDDEEMRIRETSGWQCFHTEESIDKMINKAGFSFYKLNKMLFVSDYENSEIARIYDVDPALADFYEHFLIATK